MNTESTPIHPISYSLAPYTGAWTQKEAAHLLRRTVYGHTFDQINSTVSLGMNTAVDNLLSLTAITQPLGFDAQDILVPVGTTWVNKTYPISNQGVAVNARLQSLAAWLVDRSYANTTTITEKMCHFWHNHFAVNNTLDPKATYDYHKLIHTHCLGNFKSLLTAMTINPCMLLFLNGNTNNINSPNENYAREFLELFTIGKGPQIGPGDYTNYTEEDVAAGAKIFTGWTVNNLRSTTASSVTSSFNANLHDNSNKQLSAKFGSVIIQGNNSQEVNDYINVVLQQAECAKFLCRKLYRYFVNYDLTSAVETTVIQDMANTLLTNNYDVLPVLRELFKSQHFYDLSVRGAQIKTPLESTLTPFSSSDVYANYNVVTKYQMHLNLFYRIRNQSQDLLGPPNVAGWKAYYQAPNFTKLWLTTDLLKARFSTTDYYTVLSGHTVNTNNLKVNALNVVNSLSLPNDAVSVINDLCTLYFPKDIAQTDKDALKSVLTNGLPDFEWTIQYNDYQNNPNNTTYSDPVRVRVELVLGQMFKMAQYHVS